MLSLHCCLFHIILHHASVLLCSSFTLLICDHPLSSSAFPRVVPVAKEASGEFLPQVWPSPLPPTPVTAASESSRTLLNTLLTHFVIPLSTSAGVFFNIGKQHFCIISATVLFTLHYMIISFLHHHDHHDSYCHHQHHYYHRCGNGHHSCNDS